MRNARPEIKSALDKAQQFLGLSAMVSVILAMVAMLLSSLPYIKQSLDTFSLMRCFGASKSTVLQVLAIQTILIAFFSALLGVLLGFIAQFGLAKLAGSLFLETLPPASSTPVFIGLAASIAMMFAVVLPHAWQMRNLTAMNILRRETLAPPISEQAKFLPAALVMCAMIFWQARDVKLAASTIVALVLLCVAIVGLSYVLVTLANRLFMLSPKSQVLNDMKLGVLGLKRRFGLSTVQMIGFSMGLMVLMLLALIRGDLIRNWQASLPIDAPNRFIINIQPSQIDGVKQFFELIGRVSPVECYKYKFDIPSWRFDCMRASQVAFMLSVSLSRLQYLIKIKKVPVFRASPKGRPRLNEESIEMCRILIEEEELY
ncbi:MAG: FtsX-like permease family protein [Pseudomonadota bacterium]